MSAARLADFEDDIARARDLVGLGQAIGGMTNGLVNSTDLYRSALVQGVAAWDRYVHGVVLDRAVDIMTGRRSVGSVTKVGIPLADVAVLMNIPDPSDRELMARSILAQRLSKDTYQRPDDVANALAMVGLNSIWSTAFPDARQAKIAIGVIVDRRNRIVHQCDYDPALPGTPTSLAAEDATEALDVVKNSVHAIDKLCT